MPFACHLHGHAFRRAVLATATAAMMVATIHAQDGYVGYRERLKALKSVGSSAPLPAQITSKGAACAIVEKIDAAHYYRTRSPRSIEATLADFIVFNPNRDTLWPGALVRWSSLESGNPALINVPRAPVDVWLDVSHASHIAKDGVQPRAASVAAAINELLKQNKTGFAAAVDFDFAEVYSVQQALLELGLSAEWLSGSAVAAVTEKKLTTNHVTLVKFTQIYYTISYQLPTAGNHAVLAANLDTPTLDDLFDVNDPPVYISQVNYGRTLLFRLESKHTFTEVQQALKVTQDFALGNASAQAAQAALEALQSTEFKLLVKGGSPQQAIEVISSKDFLDFVGQNPLPTADSPGVPVSYTVKQLKDNTTVALKRASDFDAVDYSRQRRTIRVIVESMKVHNDGDSGFEGAGDFTWKFWLSGQEFGAQNSERTISTGSSVAINASHTVEVDLTDSSEIRFEAEIIERDGWVSGKDDELPRIVQPYLVYQLGAQAKSGASRVVYGSGDPDVELFWRVEVLSGLTPPAPPCAQQSASAESSQVGAIPFKASFTRLRSNESPVGGETLSGLAIDAAHNRPAACGGFFTIGHMTNTPSAIDYALSQGANAIEVDLRFERGGASSEFKHGFPCACSISRAGLCAVNSCNDTSSVEGIVRHVANTAGVALLVIDAKADDVRSDALGYAGNKLAGDVIRNLFDKGYTGNVILSVAKLKSLSLLESAHAHIQKEAPQLLPRVRFSVDEEGSNADVVVDALSKFTTSIAYGTGSTAAGDSYLGAIKAAQARVPFTYVWTVDDATAIGTYISNGISAVMTDHPFRSTDVAKQKGLRLAASGEKWVCN